MGWLRDEAAHGYVVSAFDSDLRVEPGMATRSLAGCVLSDVGRVVSGGEAFRVDATPGREMRMVLRTADAIRANAYRRGGILPYHSFRLKEAPRVTVGVDGREAGSFTLPQTGDGVFAEVVLAVPAEYVTSARPLVVVSGAHVSFAWWFYQ